MFRWFYILPYLFDEAVSARRDARIRFLNAQVEILRRKLGGNRVIPSPDDRARLLAIGAEFNHEDPANLGLIWVTPPQGRQAASQVMRDVNLTSFEFIDSTRSSFWTLQGHAYAPAKIRRFGFGALGSNLVRRLFEIEISRPGRGVATI